MNLWQLFVFSGVVMSIYGRMSLAAVIILVCCLDVYAMRSKRYPVKDGYPSKEPTPSIALDSTCLNSLDATILTLPREEILRQFGNASLDFQVDMMLCADRAGLNDLSEKLTEILMKRGDDLVEPLKQRLTKADNDHSISRVLMLYIILYWEHWSRQKEMLFDPQTVGFLIANAQRISDKPLRDICLDWLEPMAEAAAPGREAH